MNGCVHLIFQGAGLELNLRPLQPLKIAGDAISNARRLKFYNDFYLASLSQAQTFLCISARLSGQQQGGLTHLGRKAPTLLIISYFSVTIFHTNVEIEWYSRLFR